ncbi:hypothetical protein M9H77_13973 [Catharanthus roseus]|uniref:Uncharacterized protein n=1 Tax=Catharanthus roseus TaxID=4058 RepID=A0ACC0BLQ1_CATRO|nr:hypothetical protein M9H77_13973 [Catharanthus roseus]
MTTSTPPSSSACVASTSSTPGSSSSVPPPIWPVPFGSRNDEKRTKLERKRQKHKPSGDLPSTVGAEDGGTSVTPRPTTNGRSHPTVSGPFKSPKLTAVINQYGDKRFPLKPHSKKTGRNTKHIPTPTSTSRSGGLSRTFLGETIVNIQHTMMLHRCTYHPHDLI